MCTMINGNVDFFKCVSTLKAMSATPEFSKREFVDQSGQLMLRCPKSMFENLRAMGLVVLVRVEDLSVMEDRWGDEQALSVAEYNALPECVKMALDWKVRPMTRNWYSVDCEAIAREITRRKLELSRGLELLSSL